MKTILFLFLALVVNQAMAQTETRQEAKTEIEKYEIDQNANQKAMSEIRKKKAERQEKNIRRYKGKKSHVSQTEKTAKIKEVIVPVAVSATKK